MAADAAYKQKRAQRGLCPQCGCVSNRIKEDGTALYCETCASRYKLRRLRVQLWRKAEGLCVGCGEPVERERLDSGMCTCQGCSDFKRAKKEANNCEFCSK